MSGPAKAGRKRGAAATAARENPAPSAPTDPSAVSAHGAGASRADKLDACSPIELLRRVQAGELSGRALSLDARASCVEHLTGEGASVAEIAHVLGVCVRTVQRDRDLVRRRNAVFERPGYSEEMAGVMVGRAEQSIATLQRIIRDRDAPASIRMKAALGQWRIARQVVQALQSIGHVRTAPRQIETMLTHRYDAISAEELLAQAQELEEMVATAMPRDRRMRRRVGSVGRVARKLLEPGASGGDEGDGEHKGEGARAPEGGPS